MERCGWVSQDQLYIDYHDREWGVPETEGRKLFEMICLEGQQAGLSWITVLKKRENYRNAFHQFDPAAVAAMTDEDVERPVQDAGIIRHRGKIRPSSAMPALTAMEQNGEPFSAFVWSFVNNTPQLTQATSLAEIPASTPESDALSKALKSAALSLSAPPSATPLCRPVARSMTMLPAASVIRGGNMIRKWQSDNADPLLSLWLESTTEAHPFISASYWKENEAMVREVYLPAAETWVWEEDGTLRGFISIIQSQFVGALFVRPTYIGQGIGRAAEPCSTALPAFKPGGLSEKRPGGEFLSCTGLSHRRQRTAGRYPAPDTDYELAGGSNAVKVSSGPGISRPRPAPYSLHNRSPASSWGSWSAR